MQELDLNNTGRPWGPADDEYLKENYEKSANVQELADHLKRSEPAIRTRAHKLGLNRERGMDKTGRWRDQVVPDIAWKIYYLRQNTNMNHREIGSRLGLKPRQVTGRLSKYNMYNHPPAGEPPEWYKTGEIDF